MTREFLEFVWHDQRKQKRGCEIPFCSEGRKNAQQPERLVVVALQGHCCLNRLDQSSQARTHQHHHLPCPRLHCQPLMPKPSQGGAATQFQSCFWSRQTSASEGGLCCSAQYSICRFRLKYPYWHVSSLINSWIRKICLLFLNTAKNKQAQASLR